MSTFVAKRPSAKQLAARRAFAARFGGKKSATKRPTSGTTMAARRFARTRRTVSRARSAGGRASPVIDGALAGVAAPFANKFLGPWGTPATLLGVGLFRKNATLTTLGAFTGAAALTASTGAMGVSPAPAGGYL